MRITLVRHGETVGQSSIRYYGASDIELSDVGRAQMRRVRDTIGEETFDAVFTSRLCRSIEAAKIITAGRAPLAPIPGFDEVNFGRWEGWTREEIAARDPVSFRLWQEEKESFRYPQGESRADFRARVTTALVETIRADPGGSVLMVLHRGVISVILRELLALSDHEHQQIQIDLGSIHVVFRNGEGWLPRILDRIDHLDGLSGQA